MKGEERSPTSEELAAMAYVDGELGLDERKAFEARMRSEPGLAREVAALNRLAVLARTAAGPEPMDFEWERIARSRSQRAGSPVAWTLVLTGALVLAFATGWCVATAEIPLWVKLAVAAIAAGFSILFVLTLRARLRTLPYDAYTEIKR